MEPSQVRKSEVGRRTVLLVVLIFAAPVLAAWALYAMRGSWDLPARNYGELLDPVRPLGDYTLTGRDGTQLRTAELKGRWTLLYLNAGDCPQPCRDDLYRTRQVRWALNEDMRRVHRVFVMTSEPSDATTFDALVAQHRDMQAVTAGATTLQALVGDLESGRAGPGVYLVDPLGNVVMWYPSGFEAKGLLSDLRRLLKVSKIG